MQEGSFKITDLHWVKIDGISQGTLRLIDKKRALALREFFLFYLSIMYHFIHHISGPETNAKM